VEASALQPRYHSEAMHPSCGYAGEDLQANWRHTFRRTFSTLLKANGQDVKVAQELLRHASAKITLDGYAQAVTSDKRRTPSKVAEMLRAGGNEGKILLDPRPVKRRL
jgi:site-specific recombinase XerD